MAGHSNLDPEQWVDRHGDYLYRFAVSKLRDESAAQDMVQETFLAAFQAAGRFSGKSSEKTWLVGILKHKIVDYIRKASREKTYDDVSTAEDLVDDFFDRKGRWKPGQGEWLVHPRKAFEEKEFWAVFEGCLGHLQDRLRAVFVLREFEGLEADDICADLDITSTNLWVMLYRARARLKTCLEENWFKANR
jgi:RNA polymerase sigma-70 factor (ECF subfamily)